MTSVQCQNQILAVLSTGGARHNSLVKELKEGERLFVGTDPTADIVIVDNQVAPAHCTISAEGGEVFVRDCYSDTGTLVDEVRINETQLRANAEIRLGGTVVNVTLANPRSTADSESELNETEAEPKTVMDHLVEDGATGVTDVHADDSTTSIISGLRLDLIQARTENDILTKRLAEAATSAPQPDPFQEEMIELLRAEVIDLQAALADQQATSVENSEPSIDVSHDETTDEQETERLVGRLEQLLLELQERDHQIETLTELLQTAEASSEAEEVERAQIGNWLNEIEERFGHREREWQVDREALQADLESLKAERDRLELAMQADTSNTKLDAAQQVLIGLRDTAESQRVKLQNYEQEVTQLRHELARKTTYDSREERMQLAEERAEIARQRKELDAARLAGSSSASNEAALKVRAFRQHLKEIHEQDRKEQQERKLSTRIARLWKRLDGS